METVLQNYSKSRSWIKLLLLVIGPVVLVTVGAVVGVKRFAEDGYAQQKGVVLTVAMRDTNWQDLGIVFEPLIDLPVKTTSGYDTNQFLLDSGAVVSSLPREWAEKSGQELAFLPRSTFKGFGDKTSFAYQGEVQILLGEAAVKLPVVFTEAVGTKSLLGRKGFFEDYSVYFNHKEKKIEIRQ